MNRRHHPMTENLLFALLLAAIVASLTAPMAAELHLNSAAEACFAVVTELQRS
jgi:hypothetical protein